jgi:hypothetical protein
MEKESKRKKSPAKALKVIIKGKMVEGKKATDVFVNAIKIIGPAKIAELNKYTIDGLPLIVSKRDNRKQMNSLGKLGYVCTHLSTIGKKSLLERIGQSLNLKIRVEVEEPSEQVIYDET